ncbi:hypothetical protein LLG96_18860 [bacterium]|nr:hypothetical protein [bacterium]
MKTACVIVFMLALSVPRPAWTAGKPPAYEKPEFLDADGDGKNDLFRDADGDGVNDISGKPYHHNFSFTDADGDGKNDLFQDADGDGINDLLTEKEQNAINRGPIAIDFDEDGINDVTGKRYGQEMKTGRFIDEDGDGIRDVPARGIQTRQMGHERDINMDRFSDEDGDGINDGRGFGRETRNENKNNQGKGRQNQRNK